MKRYLSFEEISDGKKYSSKDLVKLPCNGCNGCHECCSVTEDTVHLDPFDIFMLSKGTGCSFEKLLEDRVDFTVIDGIITPYLSKNSSGDCIFLNSQGRCTIHNFRPGFCRLFPLGRIYNDEDGFDYFLQIHECPSKTVSKQRVDKWLGLENIRCYESFITDWHRTVTALRDFVAECNDEKVVKNVQMRFLTIFFYKAYDTNADFYAQFSERLKEYAK